jgi:purine-nucleoside phosphorylase
VDHPLQAERVASLIQEKLGTIQPGTVGLVLGSGLGESLDRLAGVRALPVADIPGYPASTAPGHAGAFLHAELAGRPVLVQRGRVHLYEGYPARQVCLGVRAMALAGVRTLVLTNAAGALNPQFEAGGLMLLTDHINFSGQSPLTGPNHEPWGPRFPDMSRVYDRELAALALDAARRLGVRLERGVYVQVPGPALETPAETRAFRRLGADAIGMSTAVEAIAARHMGVKVLGLSCLTNKNLPDCMEETSSEIILEAAERSAGDLMRVIEGLLASL